MVYYAQEAKTSATAPPVFPDAEAFSQLDEGVDKKGEGVDHGAHEDESERESGTWLEPVLAGSGRFEYVRPGGITTDLQEVRNVRIHFGFEDAEVPALFLEQTGWTVVDAGHTGGALEYGTKASAKDGAFVGR